MLLEHSRPQNSYAFGNLADSKCSLRADKSSSRLASRRCPPTSTSSPDSGYVFLSFFAPIGSPPSRNHSLETVLNSKHWNPPPTLLNHTYIIHANSKGLPELRCALCTPGMASRYETSPRFFLTFKSNILPVICKIPSTSQTRRRRLDLARYLQMTSRTTPSISRA